MRELAERTGLGVSAVAIAYCGYPSDDSGERGSELLEMLIDPATGAQAPRAYRGGAVAAPAAHGRRPRRPVDGGDRRGAGHAGMAESGDAAVTARTSQFAAAMPTMARPGTVTTVGLTMPLPAPVPAMPNWLLPQTSSEPSARTA